MRFVVNSCVGALVAQYLRHAGHDVVAVWETMPHASDSTILAYAVSQDRIVVTADKDSGELVFRQDLTHRGILLLRPVASSPESYRRLV